MQMEGLASGWSLRTSEPMTSGVDVGFRGAWPPQAEIRFDALVCACPMFHFRVRRTK